MNRSLTARGAAREDPRRAVDRLGYEVIPFKKTEAAVLAHVPTGVPLTVTASPAKGQDATVDLAVALAGHGYSVSPHLSARQVRPRAPCQDSDPVPRCRHHRGVRRRGRPDGGADRVPTCARPARRPARARPRVHRHRDRWPARGSSRGAGRGAVPGPEGEGAAGHPHHHADRLRPARDPAVGPGVEGPWYRAVRARRPARGGPPTEAASHLRRAGRRRVGHVPQEAAEPALALLRTRRLRPDKIINWLAAHLGEPDTALAGFHVFTFNNLGPTEAWRQHVLQQLGPGRPGHRPRR